MRVALLLSITTFLSVAHADAQEWRLEITGSGLGVTTEASGVSAQAFAWGGRASLGYGLSNSIDLGVDVSFATASAVEWQGAHVGPLSGNLFGDLYVAELAAGARWHAGVGVARAFEHLHPFAGLRGGVLFRGVVAQELLSAENLLITSPAADTQFLPFVGAQVGLEHRFGRGFFVGLLADLAYAGSDYSHVGVSLEVAWSWY